MTEPLSLREIIAARLEIGERIEEAFDVLSRLPDRTRAALGMQSLAWPLVVRKMFEDAPKDMTVRRPPPPAAQIDRMEEVLDSMVALGRENRKWATAVFLICGRRKAVTAVARTLGCHRHTAMTWCNSGLDFVAHARRLRLAA